MTNPMIPWLNFAIKLEQKGKAFYEEAKAAVKHPRAKELFDYLVIAETNHKKYLENMKNGIAGGDSSAADSAVNEGLKHDPGEIPIFEEKTLKSIKEDASVPEMFNKAIKAERDNLELYLDMSEKQENDEMKDFFRKLASEELSHKKSLEGFGMSIFGLDFGNDDDDSETIDDYKPRPLKEIEISAEGVEFKPSEIVVDEGDKVLLKFMSPDTAHGVVCPTFGIKAMLPKGELVIEELFPDQPGKFDFFNNVPSGPGWKEMRGTIIVKETEAGKKKREAKPDDDIFG